MAIQRGVSGSPCQRLSVPVRNVLLSLWIPVALGKTKVDHVYHVLFVAFADQEVIRLHIAMDEVLVVHVL